MARVWKAGGKELYDDQVPFAPGTDEYYRYVAAWRSQALGVDYGQPRGYDADAWKREGGDSKTQSTRDYWANTYDQVRGMDYQHGTNKREGFAKAGDHEYIQTVNPATGKLEWQHDANGNGVYDQGEFYGKVGGVGFLNGGSAPDNSWNDIYGADVRNEEQKNYGRKMTGFRQIADSQGTYSWFADEEYRDPDGSTQKKRRKLDEDYFSERDNRPQNMSWEQRRSDADYWKYEDAPDKLWFDDEVRNRKNLSIYGRTA